MGLKIDPGPSGCSRWTVVHNAAQRLLIAAAGTAFCTASTLLASLEARPTTVMVSGVVSADGGPESTKPLSGATVSLVGESSVTVYRISTTDSLGSFAFSDPAPGRYVLKVSKPGYAPMDYGA